MARRKTRKYGPSTRKGQPRKTARRAFAPKRRRRRSNPKPFTQTPAFRYAGWAAGGAAAGVALEKSGVLSKTLEGFGLKTAGFRSVAFAALTILVGRMATKGKMKENMVALAVGMVIPAFASYAGDMIGSGVKGIESGNGSNGAVNEGRVAKSIARASQNPYAAAARHAAANSGGLRAIK